MKTTKATDIMTDKVITVKKDSILTEAIALMLRWHISALPVVDDEEKMIGIISEIEDVMVTDIISFSPHTELADLVHTFSKKHLRRVPILGKGEKVVGIVSRRDILREMLRRYN